MTNIDILRDEIAQAWPFNEHNYPELPDGDEARHILLHAMKDVGRIATALEPRDHGRSDEPALLRRAVRNLLVDALRFCALQDYPPSRLIMEYLREARGV